jgi:hypothetical protein
MENHFGRRDCLDLIQLRLSFILILIRERTGHKSDAPLKYERAFEEQLHKASSVLGPPVSTDVEIDEFDIDEFDIALGIDKHCLFETVSDKILGEIELSAYSTNNTEDENVA